MGQVCSGRMNSVWQLEGECNTHPQHMNITLNLPLAVELSCDESVGCAGCNDPNA